MKKSLLSLVIASALLAGAPLLATAQAAKPAAAAPAAQGSASKVVLDSSTRILTTLEQRRAEFRKDPAALKQYVTTEFNRMFDRDYAARLVLGVHGRGAADADVKAFADALADNLMSRYGTSLLDFNTKLRVRIKSESSLPGNRGVKVSSEMLRDGGEPIPVDYLIRNVGGQWKVFDVMVEGISYVQTFKNQFDAPLRQKSIAQVAADLRAGKMQANGSQ
ncbi:MAG: ABC transporter substrate-binding protein [Pseudoxanthomonas sp.]